MIFEALFQFIADMLGMSLGRKLQRRLGGRSLYRYLKEQPPPVDETLPPLPPDWRDRLRDADDS